MLRPSIPKNVGPLWAHVGIPPVWTPLQYPSIQPHVTQCISSV